MRYTDQTGETEQDFKDINEFYRKNMPMFAVREDRVYFVDMDTTAAAALQLTEDDGIILLSKRFLGELSPFDRFDLASSLAHEKMHFIAGGYAAQAVAATQCTRADIFVGANFLAALIDATTKGWHFWDANQYGEIHAAIDHIGNEAGWAYCQSAVARGLPCQTP